MNLVVLIIFAVSAFVNNIKKKIKLKITAAFTVWDKKRTF